MHVFLPLTLVLLLGILGYCGGSIESLRLISGIIIPYTAIALFLAGVAWRMIRWALAPVPFRITATGGQQKSLPWIKASPLDNPSTMAGTMARMALEIFLFRSLFRNSKADLQTGPRLVIGESKFLWLGALAFHWSFLFILLRHLRFFWEPVPRFVSWIQALDGFFQAGLPIVYATNVIVVFALAYLLLRRVADSQIRYISLFADYFVLFLLMSLAISGIFLRYFSRTDLRAVKELTLSLVTFSPVLPSGISPVLFMHLFLLSVLLIYFPFSKLIHMGGVFLSPTRNLPNNSRMKRHINPWNYPVKVHTYEEWEEEFKDKIKASGLPLDKD